MSDGIVIGNYCSPTTRSQRQVFPNIGENEDFGDKGGIHLVG